jgi:tRNA-specific 2-thiouridylase
MSGGVDSAVAAALAVKEGHSVTGVHMALMRNRQLANMGSRGCCSIEDSNDAARVAQQLEIPFYVWDLSSDFQKKVVDDFISEYKAGRTPNPCIRCNEFIKFQTLLDKALALGFDGVVTGHWARREGSALFRSANKEKDQSYVLAVIDKELISKCYFPLGRFQSKDEIRKIASDFSFEIRDKAESTDICFIERGKTSQFLSQALGEKKGQILDVKGNEIGKHSGYFHFTIGQRKGLNIKTPTKNGDPRYVLKIDAKENEVIVGTKDELKKSEIFAKENTIYESDFESCQIQIRAHSEPINAEKKVLHSSSDFEANSSNSKTVQFALSKPQKDGVSAGQALVAYNEDKVLGSYTII